MINEFWFRFKNAGFSGSVSIKGSQTKSDSLEDDSAIYNAVYEIDPDYTQACIIKGGYNKDKSGLIEISLDGLAENLDNALLEGLGHEKTFVIKENGIVVRFGYENDDILQF